LLVVYVQVIFIRVSGGDADFALIILVVDLDFLTKDD